MNAIRLVTEVEGDTISIPNMGQFSGRRVELVIVPLDDEKPEFAAASLAGLSRAYGDSEPAYSFSDLREANPQYGKR